MLSSTRSHLYPAPGHERWLCNDTAILEQLAAMQVLDYLISHTDRFYDDRTNNLFFLRNSEPKLFVNVDHDAHICEFFRPMDKRMEYHRWVELPMLQDYDLPVLLQQNIRTALSSKQRFANILNATMNGQLHAVSAVLEQRFVEDCPGEPMSKPTLDMVWDRLESVARFYKLYNSSTMEQPLSEMTDSKDKGSSVSPIIEPLEIEQQTERTTEGRTIAKLYNSSTMEQPLSEMTDSKDKDSSVSPIIKPLEIEQ